MLQCHAMREISPSQIGLSLWSPFVMKSIFNIHSCFNFMPHKILTGPRISSFYCWVVMIPFLPTLASTFCTHLPSYMMSGAAADCAPRSQYPFIFCCYNEVLTRVWCRGVSIIIVRTFVPLINVLHPEYSHILFWCSVYQFLITSPINRDN